MTSCFEAFIKPHATCNGESSSDQQGERLNHEIQVTVQNDNVKTMATWMEDVECFCGGPGAYDVLRCDLTYDPIKKKMNHNFWGLTFHLSRLKMSFRELLRVHGSSSKASGNHVGARKDGSMRYDKGKRNILHHMDKSNIDENMVFDDETVFDRAIVESKAIIDALSLIQCQNYEEQLSTLRDRQPASWSSLDEIAGKSLVIVVKLTLFWSVFTASPNDTTGIQSVKISVRGHAESDGKIINPLKTPEFIITSLALPPPCENDVRDGKHSLPDRLVMPQAKISSWSKQRKLLQKKDTFQPNGVYEVLLVNKYCIAKNGIHSISSRNDLTSYEILEGVSSNFFAIYRDNTIRTANNNVLFGYIRHLVLQYAPKCGLKYDSRPCRLEDGNDGLWKETFITSSSRLIFPIKEILIPNYEDTSIMHERIVNPLKHGNDERHNIDSPAIVSCKWKKFWTYHDEYTDEGRLTKTVPKWQLLLHEILIHGGYK